MSRGGAKISLALVVVFVVAATAILLVGRPDKDAEDGTAAGTPAVAAEVVRQDSHRLSSAPQGSPPVFVEFLDFECEACRAVYPAIEELRAEYGGPGQLRGALLPPLPGHFNSERAARAVEAAAQQGRLEQMYQRMYETQTEWGEQRVPPKDDVFRGYAVDLGLDMAAYDAAYADPATAARVASDVADGEALGVQGTPPTFFLDGQRFEPSTYQDLIDAFDAALD